MPRRPTIRIKYQVRVTRRATLQTHLRPAEYTYLSATQAERVTCPSCNNTFEQWDAHTDNSLTCPYCAVEIDA